MMPTAVKTPRKSEYSLLVPSLLLTKNSTDSVLSLHVVVKTEKSGNYTFSIDRLRHISAPKCASHAEHGYFFFLMQLMRSLFFGVTVAISACFPTSRLAQLPSLLTLSLP